MRHDPLGQLGQRPPAQLGGLVGLTQRGLAGPLRDVEEEVGALLSRAGESAALDRGQRGRAEDLDPELLLDFTVQGLGRRARVLDVTGGAAGPPAVHEAGALPQLEQGLTAVDALASHHGIGRGEERDPATQALGYGAGLAHTAIGALMLGAAS